MSKHRETGHLVERSPGKWGIVISVRDPATGKRRRKWHSFRGTKREAQVKRAELIAALAQQTYVEPTKRTVADFVRARVDQWEAAGAITARTAQRLPATGGAPDRAASRCQAAATAYSSRC
jgi:hypothetical protein